MAYIPPNPNGQATAANSAPVVLASDQAASIDSGSLKALLVAQGATNFVFSNVNSTTSQLAASAVFTGTVESVVNQQSYSILAISDQPGTITINQFIDAGGTKLAQTLSYSLVANQGFAKSGPMNGNYAQVIFQNTGASTTTTLQIDTAYGTIPSATQLNNQPIALNEVNGSAISLGQQSASASLPVVISSSQTSTQPPARSSQGVIVTSAQQKLFRTTFAKVQAGADSEFFTTIATGSGQTIAQSAGNLTIATGTTVNSETILRSTTSFTGSMLARIQTILSQRIVNQNFFVELVDVIGDGLTATASSATSLTVTIPSNPFTSANVGQSMYVGNLAGGLVGVPNRYAIASVAGNNVTFTVAGFSVTSGTCSLFGWNYYQTTYNAAVATTSQYDAQRRGWNSGNTAITTNTTASPGHMLIMANNDGTAYVADQLIASNTGLQTTTRGSRVVNLPEESTSLFLQIRAVNGSTAPASTTTWTIGMSSVENYSAQSVVVNDVKAQGLASNMGVAVTNTPAVTISSGTVTTVSTVTSVTTVASVTSSNAAIPGIIADVASAALTTTTTTATLTPTFGSSYSVTIPVTVVSGTAPTLDVQIQESDDTGTNWVAIYDFPRITATGFYRSPVFPFTGNRIRYVQTVGGTTPSFTRAINRLQSSLSSNTPYRQIIDRTISLTTLNSTTPSLTLNGTSRVQLVINIGAATTAPVLQLEGSDDNGASWYAVGTTLTSVASSTVQVTVANMTSQLLRARVSTAGSAVTAGYVLIRGF